MTSDASAPGADVRANILVVDDCPGDLAVLAGLLVDPEYNVVTASSGPDALRRLLDMSFAVILLDVATPGMDGFEVAALIKQREQCRSTPIIFLTAEFDDVGAIYRAYPVGAVDHLIKPLDERVVRARVSTFVALHLKDRHIMEQARALREADRRERELRLAEVRLLSERRYRSLVETIPASAWTADADGEELKRAVEARDEFLSIASHELRTPLTTLLLLVEGLQRQAVALNTDERFVRKITSAIAQARRIEGLVSSLLDVARIGAGRLELTLEDLDLAELVRECVERIADLAARAGAAVAFASEGPVKGRWDRLRIEQVATNLLSNAIKYGGGTPVEVRVEGDGAGARIVVSDRGAGISAEHQERIFERFERVSSAQHYGGLGMGLYITRHIVAAHGGTVSVRSGPEPGSTFTVVLPRSQERP